MGKYMRVVSCNLLLDPVTKDVVRDLWQRLADAGLPAKRPSGYPPHITVAAYATPQPEPTAAVLAIRLARIAAPQRAVAIQLESLGVFPEAGVVFLAPRVSRTLLEVHRAVLEGLDGPDMPALLDEQLLPDRWTPHVSLATHLDDEQIARIVRACLRDWRPVQGKAVGLGVRVHPDVVDAQRVAFGG